MTVIEMPLTRAMIPQIPTCALPAAAGGGATAATLAMVDWRGLGTQASAAIGVATLVGGAAVGGLVYAVTKYDQVKIDRQKRFDEANKVSLSAQMAESLANQEKMRATLHTINGEAQRAQAENANLRDDLATLRQQFMDISKELRATDLEMRATRVELQRTSDLLAATERDRNALRAELAAIRATQAGQEVRLAKVEVQQGSGENVPIPKELLEAAPPAAAPPRPTPPVGDATPPAAPGTTP